VHNPPTPSPAFPQPPPGFEPSPAPALPKARENLLRMQPAPCSCSPGSRSPWVALEKQFGSAQWARFGEGREAVRPRAGWWMGDGGEVDLDHRLPSTNSWPAGEAGKGGKKHLTPRQEAPKTFRRDFSSPFHLYQK